MSEPNIIKNLPIQYKTDDVTVSFCIEFGQGQDANIYTENDRKNYLTPYDFEEFDIDGKKMYRLLANEGPFVMKIKDVNIIPKNGEYKKRIIGGYTKYDYGMSVVLDLNKEPIYETTSGLRPSNDIERDGIPWVVKNNNILKIDQNGEASFQWTTAKALDKGVKPTEEQIMMGVEERHENSGMIYVSFQPSYTEETIYDDDEEEEDEGPYKGITRGLSGGVTRGVTRGISSAARVGYGSKAKSDSKRVTTKHINNSRYVLPIRLRIIGDTSEKTKCAKDLESAMRVDELQKNTGIIPDE